VIFFKEFCGFLTSKLGIFLKFVFFSSVHLIKFSHFGGIFFSKFCIKNKKEKKRKTTILECQLVQLEIFAI